MEIANYNASVSGTKPPVHWGHFGAVMLTVVFLVGVSWMKNPALFSFKKSVQTADANVPHYYAYVPPADDNAPEVAGASTQNQGPMVIGDDGTLQPVDMGKVLGATTQDVQLSLNDIKVNAIPETNQAVINYFNNSQIIEASAIDQNDFASALSSGDQAQINAQAQKLILVNSQLQKLSVPEGLVKLQKLKIIQYNSAIALLQNFTKSDQDPDLIASNLQQFIKSQQDLDDENAAMAQKYGQLDPLWANYTGAANSSNQ